MSRAVTHKCLLVLKKACTLLIVCLILGSGQIAWAQVAPHPHPQTASEQVLLTDESAEEERLVDYLERFGLLAEIGLEPGAALDKIQAIDPSIRHIQPAQSFTKNYSTPPTGPVRLATFCSTIPPSSRHCWPPLSSHSAARHPEPSGASSTNMWQEPSWPWASSSWGLPHCCTSGSSKMAHRTSGRIVLCGNVPG